VVVHGDARNYCTALVTVDPEGIAAWASGNGLGSSSYRELSESPRVVGIVQGAVDQLNAKLASYQTIKKFAVLPKDFTVEDGELTPSLKVKRKAVEKKYMDILDRFYDNPARQQGSVQA
jgi:long-chain acyl-CoA synthetase